MQSRSIIQYTLCILFVISYTGVNGQDFFFGADQSYVNEMEDCSAQYKENGIEKDVYSIYQDHGCNLTRLRLWHTPSWYDQLNEGNRYSDLEDVMKSIRRSKNAGMQVLLDFHLSDNWADPSKQLVPSAWLSVVEEVDLLGDSLYQYIYKTLTHLYQNDLLPEMVQIGNETNRGILLSPEDNQTWTLEWSRNAHLFNRAIQAVRTVSQESAIPIQVMLHVADPSKSEWWINEFIQNGVSDFDLIGMSYYWAWHKPTTIPETGQVIRRLRTAYPDKEVIIVETGYIWTTDNFDNANNIISETHPDYEPASPLNQKKWLIDLTQEVIDQGGRGVIYWEPSWVSTPCWNQWDQGSHQEHATFFDFDHNLLLPGGIEWMEHTYSISTNTKNFNKNDFSIQWKSDSKRLEIDYPSNQFNQNFRIDILNYIGQSLMSDSLNNNITYLDLVELPLGIYVLQITRQGKTVYAEKLMLK